MEQEAETPASVKNVEPAISRASLDIPNLLADNGNTDLNNYLDSDIGSPAIVSPTVKPIGAAMVEMNIASDFTSLNIDNEGSSSSGHERIGVKRSDINNEL